MRILSWLLIFGGGIFVSLGIRNNVVALALVGSALSAIGITLALISIAKWIRKRKTNKELGRKSISEYPSLKCPKCGSINIAASYSNRWECRSCGKIFT